MRREENGRTGDWIRSQAHSLPAKGPVLGSSQGWGLPSPLRSYPPHLNRFDFHQFYLLMNFLPPAPVPHGAHLPLSALATPWEICSQLLSLMSPSCSLEGFLMLPLGVHF